MTDWAAELRRCVRCGACREVCPVFDLTRLETDVARGRLARIEQCDQMDRFVTADRDALSRCLQCGRCVEVCQSNVRVPDIVRDAKARSGGATAIESSVAGALGDPARLRRLTKRARVFLAWLARATPDDAGLRLRFALPYFKAGRYVPRIPRRSYLARVAPRAAAGQERVALFLGCGAGHLFDGVGDAIDAILTTMQLVAAVPEQACCGLPAWGMGADREARIAAANWLEAFVPGDYDAILCACASCAAHLQRNLPEVLAGDRRADQAARIADNVHDFFAWLRKRNWRADLGGQRIAVHLPCHARHDVRDGEALIPLLIESGATVIELPDALDQACCGMGGAFGVRHAELSRAIGEKKVQAMLRERPDVIVTSCTGCLLQLRDLVERSGARVRVCHAAELLAG